MSLELKFLKRELQDQLAKAQENTAAVEQGNIPAEAMRKGFELGLESAINSVDLMIAQANLSMQINDFLS